jgi:hypothetical protein
VFKLIDDGGPLLGSGLNIRAGHHVKLTMGFTTLYNVSPPRQRFYHLAKSIAISPKVSLPSENIYDTIEDIQYTCPRLYNPVEGVLHHWIVHHFKSFPIVSMPARDSLF